MLRLLVKNGGYELAGFAVVAICNVVIIPFLLGYFGSDGYGVISTGVLILSFLGLSNAGVANGFIHVSHDLCQNSDRLQKEAFMLVVLFLLSVSIPVLLVYQLWADLWLNLVDKSLDIHQRKVINLFVLLLPVHLLKGLIESLYRLRLEGRTASIFSAIYSLNLVFAFCITIVLNLDLLEFTIVRIVYIVLLIAVILYREFAGLRRISLRLNPRQIFKGLFSFATWDIVNQVNNTTINSVSGIVFIRLFGVSNLYILDIPKKFIEMVNVISVKSSLYLFPIIRTVNIKDRYSEFDKIKKPLFLTRIVLFFGLLVFFHLLSYLDDSYAVLGGDIAKYILTFYFAIAIFQPMNSFWYGIEKPVYSALHGATIVLMLLVVIYSAFDADMESFLYYFYFIPGVVMLVCYFMFFDRGNLVGLCLLAMAGLLSITNSIIMLTGLLLIAVVIIYRFYVAER